MKNRYILSILDQVVLSGLNFLLSIFLIKTMASNFFGIFVFWNTIALLAVGIQTSLISTPMSVFLPAAASSAEKIRTESIFSSANFILMMTVFSIIVAANLLFATEQSGEILQVLTVAAFVAGTLLREYARSTGFAHERIRTVLIADGVHVAVACMIFAYFLILREAVSLEIVFGLLALGSILGGLASLIFRDRSERVLSVTMFSLRAYSPIWEQSKWALVGAMTTQAQSRGYVYLLSAFAGPAAVAMIAAGEIMYRPISLVMTAWGRIARPHFSGAAAGRNYSEIDTVLRKTMSLSMFFLITYYMLLYATWSPLRGFVYEDKYDDIGWIVVGWGVSNMVMQIQGIYSIALQALSKFKILSYGYIFGGIVSLSVVALVLSTIDYRFSILGNISGALVSGLFVYRAFIIVSRKLKIDAGP